MGSSLHSFYKTLAEQLYRRYTGDSWSEKSSGPIDTSYIKTSFELQFEQLSLEHNEYIAFKKWFSGEKPSFSTDIAENTTAGYGKLDEMGNFEFPLYPAEYFLTHKNN